MSNGIALRQNENPSIARLAAQRQLYSEAGHLDEINSIISVILPFILSIIVTLETAGSYVKVISYLLSVVSLIASILVVKATKKKKQIAAAIQLEFDVYVFNMPWDTKAFGKRRDLSSEIVDKSKNILSNDDEKKKLFNWYQIAADNMPLWDGILTCQKENIHWDVGLRKRYRLFLIVLVIIITAIIVVIGLVKNELFQDFVARVVFIVPILRWLLSSMSSINNDIERINDLSKELLSDGDKDMNELQYIQKTITDHRKSAIKIPDFIYKLFQNNDEDRARRIVEYNSNSRT